MRISERKFLAFLDTECSKKCNMKNVAEIIKVSREINETVLTEADVRYILRHRGRLNNCYGFTNIQSLK